MLLLLYQLENAASLFSESQKAEMSAVLTTLVVGAGTLVPFVLAYIVLKIRVEISEMKTQLSLNYGILNELSGKTSNRTAPTLISNIIAVPKMPVVGEVGRPEQSAEGDEPQRDGA